MLAAISNKVRYLKTFLSHPAAPEGHRRELLRQATAPSQVPHRWTDGAPISEVRNAHYTNTAKELSDGLSHDYNFLEGDVWLEGVARRIPGLDHFREPIMAHNYPDVDGLSLREWLEVGKASGKGIKLDIKQSAAIPKIIETLQSAEIPQERLILNADMVAGPGWDTGTKFQLANVVMDVQTQVEEMKSLREAFPKATLAVGLYTAASPSGTHYTEQQLSQAWRFAEQLGGPITFPLRAEFVTPEIVEKLKPYGSVSIWNDPASYLPKDLEKARQEFRSWGVDGVIDLRSD